jgi:HTH-type transcriptional regulator/antitoxin HigA
MRAFDTAEYGRLLQEVQPKVIRNKKEHARQQAEFERLISKGDDDRTSAETAILEMLAALVDNYEENTYPSERTTPGEVLEFLIRQNNLRFADLPLPSARVSEILSGKSSVRKAESILLAKFFRVFPALFIEKP